MKPFTRIGGKLVMDMEAPDLKDYLAINPQYHDTERYKAKLAEYNSRPSYDINPSDLKEFEFGKQYYEGKDFYVGERWNSTRTKYYPTAFAIHKPEQKTMDWVKRYDELRTSKNMIDSINQLVKEVEAITNKERDETISVYIQREDEHKVYKTLLENKLKERDAEIERLKAWKESSISVTPDMQAIGRALNVKLGESVHDKILPAILAQQEEIKRLKGKLSTS